MGRGRKLLVAAGVAVLLTLAWTSAFAQDTSEKEKPEPSATETAPPAANPAKTADIRKLLELTGAKKNAVEFAQQLGAYLKDMLQKRLPAGVNSQQIGETVVAKLTAHLGSDEMIVRLIPIYDKAFSGEEIKSIIQFYESPAGKRLLEATPQVMEDANIVSEAWIKELIPEIMEQMQEQFPELKEGSK